jgi:hypothetical protein
MSLSYYFTFSARPETTAEELVAFLKGVETEAKRMGFYRTLVVNASFDTAKRREFAKAADGWTAGAGRTLSWRDTCRRCLRAER